MRGNSKNDNFSGSSYIGEDNYGIFQKTPENNNCNNRVYFYSLDSRFNDAASVNQIKG